MNISVFTGENELEFYARFPDDRSCYEYLYALKWEKGFRCSKCGCEEEYRSNKAYYKLCKGCLHHESSTSNTLFHKLKFPIRKAFIGLFKMSATTKSISAEQLSRSLGINRKTALFFQHKVRLAMSSSLSHPLTGRVEVDECYIGGEEEGVSGREVEKKSPVVLAVEKSGNFGIKRVYAKVINDTSSGSIKPLFDDHISKEAKVQTDCWRAYLPIKKEGYAIEQEKSDPKSNFKTMHRVIQQLKSWIRGIHHHVDPSYLQGYLNEFCFRINRSIFKETIFHKLLTRMVLKPKTTRKILKFNYI